MFFKLLNKVSKQNTSWNVKRDNGCRENTANSAQMLTRQDVKYYSAREFDSTFQFYLDYE